MSNSFEPIRFSVPLRDGGDKKRKLGKGLNALLGEVRREEPVNPEAQAIDGVSPSDGAGNLLMIPVAAIVPLPGQPRTRFDDEALDQLAASIAARGVIQPVLVQPTGNDTYQLVAGERRWRAAQRAKLHEIPAIVRTLDPGEVMALALIENLQREDLNPLEEARAYQRLAEDGMTQADIARMIDKSRSHVANLQRLLTLPEPVQQMVEEGKLSMGHARALIGHAEAEAVAQRAIAANLSVREVEDAVRRAAAPTSTRQPRVRQQGAHHADIAAVEAQLQDFLGMTIRIKAESDPRKGAMTIHYRTLDQLDLICQRLTGGDV